MPAYGSFGQMIIDLGVNLGPLGTGLAAAKSQLSSLNSLGSQIASGLTGSFARTAGSVALISGAIYGIQQAFSAAINAADEYRLATINIAATMTDWLDKPIKTQEDFNDHLAYSQEMYKVLELEAVKHFASGKDLQLAWTIMTQKGVQLRYDEVNALGMVVDKIKLATQGQISTIQIAQEIRSLLNGQARTTDQIALLLKDKYGKAWKDIVNDHRKAGDLLQWLAKEWQGLAMAQEHILNTLESQSTTLWTMIRRVGREGLAGAYQYIVDVLKTINGYLFEHEAELSQGIQQGWLAIEPAVTAIGEAIQSLLSYLWENGEAISAIIGLMGDVVQAIISIIASTLEWIDAHGKVLAGIVAILLAYKGAVILGGVISGIAVAVKTLGIAVAALEGAFVAAGIAGVGMSAMLPVIGGIGIALGIAAAAAYGLYNWITQSINKKKELQEGSKGLSVEEVEKFRRQNILGPIGEEWAEKEGIVPPTAEVVNKADMYANAYKNAQEKLEKIIKKEKLPTLKLPGWGEDIVVEPGKVAEVRREAQKVGEEFEAFLNEANLQWDYKKNDWVTKITHEKLQLPEEVVREAFDIRAADKKYKRAATDADKGKKGKGPEKLLADRFAETKALRAKELEEQKAFLAGEEDIIKQEDELGKLRLEQGKITGESYTTMVRENAIKIYQLELGVIAKRREIELNSYNEQRAIIEEEHESGAISDSKYKSKLVVAKLQYEKQLVDITRDGQKARMKLNEDEIKRTDQQIKDRMTILTTAMSLMTEAATGSFEKKQMEIMNIHKKFDDLSVALNKISFAKESKIEPDAQYVKTVNSMLESAKILGGPWALAFVEAVKELMESPVGPEGAVQRQTALEKIRGLRGPIEEDAIFKAKWGPMIEGMTNTASSGVSDLFGKMLTGIQEGSKNLGQQAQQIIVNMFNNMLNEALKPGFEAMGQWLIQGVKAVFSAFGFGGSGGGKDLSHIPGGGSIDAQAFGGAWYKGIMQTFGTGGIVTRPTLFAMAGGMGLMGEAGPEAVMPLTRLPSGKLGVEALTGKGQTNIIINNNAKNADVKAEEGPAGDIIITIDELVSKAYSRRGQLHKLINAGSGIVRR